jgi:integrase/recombinase XerD
MTGRRPSLRDALGDYLSLRRALGFQLANASRLLGQFVGYLETRGADTVTTEHALAWATQPAGTSVHWQAIRLSAVRGFAAYLHSLDPAAEVIPAGQFRAGQHRICIPMPRSARSSRRRPRCGRGRGRPPTRP